VNPFGVSGAGTGGTEDAKTDQEKGEVMAYYVDLVVEPGR
jgi:hypothetical protein